MNVSPIGSTSSAYPAGTVTNGNPPTAAAWELPPRKRSPSSTSMTHAGALVGATSASKWLSSQHRGEPAREAQIEFQGAPIERIGQWPPRFGCFEQFLLKVGHLLIGVFLVEPNEVGECLHRRVRSGGEIGRHVSLELELHHHALRAPFGVFEILAQLGMPGIWTSSISSAPQSFSTSSPRSKIRSACSLKPVWNLRATPIRAPFRPSAPNPAR